MLGHIGECLAQSAHERLRGIRTNRDTRVNQCKFDAKTSLGRFVGEVLNSSHEPCDIVLFAGDRTAQQICLPSSVVSNELRIELIVFGNQLQGLERRIVKETVLPVPLTLGRQALSLPERLLTRFL